MEGGPTPSGNLQVTKVKSPDAFRSKDARESPRLRLLVPAGRSGRTTPTSSSGPRAQPGRHGPQTRSWAVHLPWPLLRCLTGAEAKKGAGGPRVTAGAGPRHAVPGPGSGGTAHPRGALGANPRQDSEEESQDEHQLQGGHGVLGARERDPKLREAREQPRVGVQRPTHTFPRGTSLVPDGSV